MNQVLKSILRKDFKSFVIKCFQECSGINAYNDNWHISVICNEINDMLDGKNRNLILNVPPRHLKSIICSVALPAFILGHNPKSNVMCVSYSDELASKRANDCRNIMQSAWYQEIFPRTKIQSFRRSINDFSTTLGGGRFATSVGGTITGRGAEWIIIDDPLKPNDALSDIQREKVNDWFGTTLYSRLNDKATGRILVIMQRLHQNDLTGFLLNSDMGLKHVKLQAIATTDEHWEITSRITGKTSLIERKPGDLLHPSRENEQVMDDIKNKLGSFAFSGQYQQEPVPVEGGLVKESWLHYYPSYDCFKNEHQFRVFISWDTAAKTGLNNAYSAACVVLMSICNGKPKYYLIQVIRGKWEIPDLIRQVIDLYNTIKYDGRAGGQTTLLIEDQSSGEQLIQILNHETDSHGLNFNIEPIKPQTDKISRLGGVSAYIENGDILFPQFETDWWSDFKSELLNFPGCKYKDQVDALTQAISYGQSLLD